MGLLAKLRPTTWPDVPCLLPIDLVCWYVYYTICLSVRGNLSSLNSTVTPGRPARRNPSVRAMPSRDVSCGSDWSERDRSMGSSKTPFVSSETSGSDLSSNTPSVTCVCATSKAGCDAQI
jgi:hypothetical protein